MAADSSTGRIAASCTAAQPSGLNSHTLNNDLALSEQRARRRESPGRCVVISTRTRVTCAAVTSGTPSCSTLAVMHISAMPPGAMASTRVGAGSPRAPPASNAQQRRRQRSSRQHAGQHSRRHSAARFRSERRSKRAPSAQPSSTCAAFDRARRQRRKLHFARRSARSPTASGPNMNAFGMPSRVEQPAGRSAAMPSSSASRAQSKRQRRRADRRRCRARPSRSARTAPRSPPRECAATARARCGRRARRSARRGSSSRPRRPARWRRTRWCASMPVTRGSGPSRPARRAGSRTAPPSSRSGQYESDLARHDRREVQAERGADHDLAELRGRRHGAQAARRRNCRPPSPAAARSSRAAAACSHANAAPAPRTSSKRERRIDPAVARRPSLADAEAREDLAQQIVGAELAGDRCRAPHARGAAPRRKTPSAAISPRRRCEMRRAPLERAQMALAREEHRLAGRRPSPPPRGSPARSASMPCAGLRRHARRASAPAAAKPGARSILL